MKNHRKPAVFAFGVIATVLLLASTAFACTVFRGRFTVEPISPGSGSVTAVGAKTSMAHCPGHGPSGTANLDSATGNFRATVASADECGPDNKLRAGVYTVTWNLGSSVNNNGVYDPRINDCMNASTRQLGTMVVDLNGDGSGTYTLSGTTPPGEVQICVSDLTGGQGNQVPVKLI